MCIYIALNNLFIELFVSIYKYMLNQIVDIIFFVHFYFAANITALTAALKELKDYRKRFNQNNAKKSRNMKKTPTKTTKNGTFD